MNDTPHTYTDAYLDHWGHVYVDNNLGEQLNAQGAPLSFEEFLRCPQDFLFAYAFDAPVPHPNSHHRPLLAGQRIIQQRLDRETIGRMESRGDEPVRAIRFMGGRLLQPLRRLAWPKPSKCRLRGACR